MKNLITGFLNQVMLAEAPTGKRKTYRWNMIRRDLVLTIPYPHRSEIGVDLRYAFSDRPGFPEKSGTRSLIRPLPG